MNGGAGREPVDGGAKTVVSHVRGTEGSPGPETVERGAGGRPIATESLSAAALDPGRDLSIAFSVGAPLGEGGMGKVLEARDPRLGRAVAVKVMRPSLLRDPVLRRRFVIEAQVSAQLEHPHIVPVYGMEKADGVPAFTMRLLPGNDLSHLIAGRRKAVEADNRDEGVGDLHERLEIFLRVCDAIAYANDRGVIHRDLKPDNVMLGAHREVYVVDWGVAKVLGVADSHGGAGLLAEATLAEEDSGESADDAVHVSTAAETRHGQSLGTVVYMPPEQMAGDTELHGPASDQFALGMMLQELVTLRPPRAGANPVVLMAAALEAERSECVRFDGRAVPAALRAIIERATQKAPGDRYPSIAALAEDVRRFQLGEPVSVHAEGPITRLWRQLSRRPGLALAIVFALLLAGAATSLYSVRQTLATERDARTRAADLERMSAAVLAQSQSIDGRLAHVAMLVEGLAVAAEVSLNGRAPEVVDDPFGAAGRLVGQQPALAALRPHERYGMPVSFETPSFLYPAGVDEAVMASQLSRLAPVADRMRETLLRSGGDGPWTPEEAQHELRDGRPPLHVSYVGLESGLLVNFPGYEAFPDEYDHRRRPWYVAVGDRRGPFFGAPYPDASGSAILVPCNRAIHDTSGGFMGVAGADMAMDDVIAALPVRGLDGWVRGGLVNGERELVIDTENRDVRSGLGLHGDEAFAGSSLEPDIRRAIEERGSGWVEREAEWVFFHRLTEIDWTYLAWVRR